MPDQAATHATATAHGAGRRPDAPPRRKARRSWWFWTPLVLLWVVPVVVVAVLIPTTRAVQRTELSVPRPQLTEVGQLDLSYLQAVDVTVTLPPASEVTPGTSGVVTRVAVSAGQGIASGQELIAVDGTPVYALRGDTPLFRDLSLGAQGPDVLAMANLLVARGTLDPAAADARFGPEVQRAVKTLQRQMGVAADGVFRVSYGAYVPAGIVAADQVLVDVGDRITSEDPVIRGYGPPLSVAMSVTGGNGESPQPPAGALTLKVGDESVPLSGLPLSGEDRAATSAALAKEAASGAISSRADGDSATVYSGAVLASAASSTVGTLPATALYVSDAGTTCVFAVSDGIAEHAVAEPVVPSAIDGALGKASVPAALVGTTVLVDPFALDAARLATCG